MHADEIGREKITWFIRHTHTQKGMGKRERLVSIIIVLCWQMGCTHFHFIHSISFSEMKRKLHGKYTNGSGWIIDIELIECVLSKNQMNSLEIDYIRTNVLLIFSVKRNNAHTSRKNLPLHANSHSQFTQCHVSRASNWANKPQIYRFFFFHFDSMWDGRKNNFSKW